MTSDVNRRYFALLGGASPSKTSFSDKEVTNGFQMGLDSLFSSPERVARIQQQTQREQMQFSKDQWEREFEMVVSKQLDMQADQLDLERYKTTLMERQLNADMMYKSLQLEGMRNASQVDGGQVEIYKLLNTANSEMSEYIKQQGKNFKGSKEFEAWIGSDPHAQNLKTTIAQLECSLTGRSLDEYYKTESWGANWLALDFTGGSYETYNMPFSDPGKVAEQQRTDQINAFMDKAYKMSGATNETELMTWLDKPENAQLKKNYQQALASRTSSEKDASTTAQSTDEAEDFLNTVNIDIGE